MTRRILILLSASYALLLFALPLPAQTSAYWRFEEASGTTISDSSGHAPGTLLNGIGFSTDVPLSPVPATGQSNSHSLFFDGINDVALIPDSGALQPNTMITIEAWVKPTPQAHVILSKRVGSGSCCAYSYRLELNPFRFQTTAVGFEHGNHVVTAEVGPPSGEWHHVAATASVYDRTLRLFIDGVQVAATGPELTGPLATYDANPLLIGAADEGFGIPGNSLFAGDLDEVRVSYYALTPSEFLNAYAPTDTLYIDDTTGDRRFRLNTSWQTVQGGGQSGIAHALATSPIGVVHGGLFYFFGIDNPEMLVKVLPGCSVNGMHWVFIAAGTNVAFTTAVTDTFTGRTKAYSNPDLTPALPVQDVAAFPCN